MNLNGHLSVAGQIKNLKFEQLATDPASPALSQAWYNTTTLALKYYDGVSVQIIATGSGALSQYMKLDGSASMTGPLTLSSADQTGAPDTTAAAKGYVDTGLATKQATITGAATSIVSANLGASLAVVSDSSGKVAVAATTTAAEIEYVHGVTSAIQTQLNGKQATIGYVPVNKAGDTLGGALNLGGNTLTGIAAPVNATDALRKIDLDVALSKMDFQADVDGVQVDATLDPGATPATGARYVISNPAALHANFGTISGVAANDIVQYNGTAFVVAYDVVAQGQGALAWDRLGGMFIRYNGTNWAEFGGLSGVTTGVGLSKSGNTISVNLGAGITSLPTNEVGVDALAAGGLFTTVDGSTASTASNAQLSVKLSDAALALSTSGLTIAANGVVASHLNTSIVGNGLQGAGGTALSVKTASASGIIVDGTGVSIDDTELRNRVVYRDGAQAMTGPLTLSSSDQSAGSSTTAVSKGYVTGLVAGSTTAITNLTTRLAAGYFMYDGTASAVTSATVTHNMNNKYVQVSIVDELDEVIIPESITFTSANALSVTFAVAQKFRAIVTGLAN